METDLANGDNVIDDPSGNETIRFEGEAREGLSASQNGTDLVLSAGSGTLTVAGYFTDPSRFTFEDGLGVFDPMTDTGGDSSEPPLLEDPGDTLETALAVNGSFEGENSVGGADDAVDLFSFTAPADGDVNVILNGLAGETTVELLDSEGTVLAQVVTDGGETTLSLPVDVDTTYFVQVTASGEGEAEYGLSIDFEQDLGDTFDTATIVGNDISGETSMSVGFDGDPGDFTQITPDADGTLVIEADAGDDDPILTLFAADGSVLATGVQNDFGETRIEFELTAGESYVVGIELSGDGGTQYDLSSSYQVSTGSEDVSVIDTNELGA